MKKQNVRTLALIVCTFTYLLVGAAIFDVLESDNERKEREALQEVESMIFKKYNFTKDDYAFMELVVLQTIPHRAGQQWKFAGAFYYATTVLTTIGYGHSTPNTVSGKLFTMLYATIGIPLGLVMFQSIGERLNKCSSIIIKQVKKMAKKSQVQATEINLIFVVITLSILIIVAGAAVFSRYEDWSYFDATYYCFVTLTTIGFGDYVALQNNDALASQPEYVAFSLIFILFGLTVVAASVNLLVLRFVTMNTVDERKDEMEARQAAQGAVRLEGDVITTNGSIISGHFGRAERGPGGSGGVGLGVGPGGGMDHRILSSLSLSDIASGRHSGIAGQRLKPRTSADIDDYDYDDEDERLNAVIQELQALAEAKLAQQAADYEERLTELHSVIAELTRRMEVQRGHTIKEETEEEEDDEEEEAEREELLSDSPESVEAGEEMSKAAGDKAEQEKTVNMNGKDVSDSSSDFSESDMLAMIVKPMDSPRRRVTGLDGDENVVTQVLKRELRLLQEENERLRARDREREVEIARLTSTLDTIAASPRPSLKSQSQSSTTSASKDINKSKEKTGGGSSSGIDVGTGTEDADKRMEIDKLRAKLDSAKATNDLLTLQLKESRLTAENMFIAMTKEESNCVALQMALESSRRAARSYEALLALMDAELSVLFVNCRLAGINIGGSPMSAPGSPALGKDGAPKPLLEKEEAARLLNRAYDRRNHADTIARELARDLDAAADDSGAAQRRKSSTEDVDCRLRAHAELWKAETDKVANTVWQTQKDGASASSGSGSARHRLGRPHGGVDSPPGTGGNAQLDFEAAVLAQELYASKEEKAELESRLFVCNKERQALELQYGAGEAREAALKALVEALKAQIKAGEASEESTGADCVERRDGYMRLALRVHELGIAVETLIQDSDHREKEAGIFLADLRKANQALIHAVDRSKSKNQLKSRRLEQEINALVDRHALEVQALTAKVSELQNQLAAQQARMIQVPRHRYASTTSSSTSSLTSLMSPVGYGNAVPGVKEKEKQGIARAKRPIKKKSETQL